MGFQLPGKNSNASDAARFEAVAAGSVGRWAFLIPFPRAGGQFFKGRGFTPMRMPCDACGWLYGSLVPVAYDAKTCDDPKRFGLGSDKIVKPHQREFLVEAGGTGAISGLLVEATAPEVNGVFWLGWQHLQKGPASLAWTDPAWTRLGRAYLPFDFTPIIRQVVRKAA